MTYTVEQGIEFAILTLILLDFIKESAKQVELILRISLSICLCCLVASWTHSQQLLSDYLRLIGLPY